MFSSRMPICVNCNAGAHSLCNMVWCLCRKLNLSPLHPKLEILVAARSGFAPWLTLVGFFFLCLATILFDRFPMGEWNGLALLAAYGFFAIKATQQWRHQLG